MFERKVKFYDGSVRTRHEVTSILHTAGMDTTIEVMSGDFGDQLGTRLTHALDPSLTFEAAEEWVKEQPEFAPYVDPEEQKQAEVDRILRILTDEQAKEVIDSFPEWASGVTYDVGDRVRYAERLYKCVQAHTSQDDWHPDIVPALWLALQPEEGDDDPTTVPEWVQPTGAQDAYNTGDRVTFNGHVYESTIDGNVWSPTDYPQGWTLIE